MIDWKTKGNFLRQWYNVKWWKKVCEEASNEKNGFKKDLRDLSQCELFSASCRLRLQIYELFKSDFLRVPRIGRHSHFSFISPKHSYGWTCSRKNCFKFQRFILRPKFKKVWNLHPMAVFASSNVQNFTLLYENSGGVKTVLWKQILAQILFHS